MYLTQFVQFPVKVEPSGAAMVNALAPLTTAMEIKIALIAVMRVDVLALHLAALAVSMSRYILIWSKVQFFLASVYLTTSSYLCILDD